MRTEKSRVDDGGVAATGSMAAAGVLGLAFARAEARERIGFMLSSGLGIACLAAVCKLRGRQRLKVADELLDDRPGVGGGSDAGAETLCSAALAIAIHTVGGAVQSTATVIFTTLTGWSASISLMPFEAVYTQHSPLTHCTNHFVDSVDSMFSSPVLFPVFPCL